MKERFLIGSADIAGIKQYFIYDKLMKESLYYPTIDANGKLKKSQDLEQELTEYCNSLNKKERDGLFCVKNVELTKYEADFIAKKLNDRLKLCESVLETAQKDKNKHEIVSFHEEIDTINSIIAKLYPIRFPKTVLRYKDND